MKVNRKMNFVNLLGIFTILFLTLLLTQCRKQESLNSDNFEETLLEKEKEYVKSLNFDDSADAKLIGFNTIYVDDGSLEEFNEFYFENKKEIDEIAGHFYHPIKGEIRVYFPVNSAIVKAKNELYEASEEGDVNFAQDTEFEFIEIIARKKTDKVTGVSTNIIRNDTIFLAEAIKVDHLINDNILVYNFGRKEITNHDHSNEQGHGGHGHGEHNHDGDSNDRYPVSCTSNHGNYANCTVAFNVWQGRCSYKSNVCMDYNGIFTDCENYSSGAGRYQNWYMSDCHYAMLQGRCWNEIM